MFSSRTQKYWYKYTNTQKAIQRQGHNIQVQSEAWQAQVKLIIESQQHSCRTADEIFLDSRPLKASTSSQRCVLCTCVLMYLCICESPRCISPLEAVQSINFPFKNVSSPRWEALRPKFEPFFPAAAQTLSILQHAVQTLCRISQYSTAQTLRCISTIQTLSVVFYSMRKHCCPSCLTWPKHWHTMAAASSTRTEGCF